MYTTLDFTSCHYKDGYKKVPSNLPKPDFMPTKLIRVSDMAVVNGSDVNKGYCALSYSWNQSGEILHDEATGKYKRIDEGKHKIISYDNKLFEIGKLKKIYQALRIMDKNNYLFTKATKYVKFETIIQKICQLFNIKYIWYDQMCINQSDKEEKQREIRNMHHIYSNAHCTVALVPDYNFFFDIVGINREEYFKRLWTLEEAIKSKRLLFVVRDNCYWGEQFRRNSLEILNRPLSEISVAQILHHAHQRTSTKEHDRVFALIHLFPEFMQHIDIDYDQPLEELMIRFYCLLAKKDLSILLFGNIDEYYNSTIQKYKFLPSWTGVNGKHITYGVTTSFRKYGIIGKTMYIKSKFVTNGLPIDIDALTILRKEDLPPPNDDINYGRNKFYYRLCTRVQLPGSSETINVSLHYSYYRIVVKEDCFDGISKELKRLSKFMETKKENLYWCHSQREEYQKVIHINFDVLTEDVNDPLAQYFILSEVSFKNKYNHFYYPVIKREQGEEYYKAIGYIETYTNNKDIFSGCNLPNKQTFLIQ